MITALVIKELKVKKRYEIIPIPSRMAINKPEITNVGKTVEKLEPQYVVGGNVTCNHSGEKLTHAIT